MVYIQLNMAQHCIIKSVSDEMKKDLKSGMLDLKALYKMDNSAQRRAVFEKYASPELAKFINGKFEEAMVSKQKGALQKWANETFNPKQKNGEPYKAMMKKINSLDELGVLNPDSADSYKEDLVANKMGVTLSPKEIKGITDRADTLQKAFEKKDSLGNPSIEYWKARDDMDKYLSSLNPSSAWSVITDPIRRANILFHISGVLKKTSSEVSEGALQATAKRLSNLLTGEKVNGMNNEFARQTIADNMKTIIHSGYNPLLMQELKDGENFLGEGQPHTQGKGPLRAYARIMMNMIQHMYNTPAQFFASLSWTDTANQLSTQFANGDKAKALELFKDATKIAPDTTEGQEIRQRAIEEGLKASFQNKGALSNATLKFRDALDKMNPDFNIGKQLIPIAKVPANAIGRGLDYAGFGLIRAFHTDGAGTFQGWNRLPEAIKELNKGNKLPIQSVVKQFVQNGLGLALAAVIVHNLNPDDYVPAYSGSSGTDKGLKNEQNSIYNSIKLGGRYLALSFLGPLSVPVMAGLVAKKEGALGYVKGLGESLADVPGVSQLSDLFNSIKDLGQKSGYQHLAKDMMNGLSDYFTSIVLPSEVKDVATGTDSIQRNNEGNAIGKAEQKIPGLRENLPPKVSEVTGQEQPEEGLASRSIMGSNLTTASDDPVVKELNRLSKSGQSPTIGGIEYSSTRIKDLIKQVGSDKSPEILEYYGEYYHEQASNEIESDQYKDSSDEEKKSILNDIHRDGIEETLSHFGYQKK